MKGGDACHLLFPEYVLPVRTITNPAQPLCVRKSAEQTTIGGKA
jgi:hypothetical protein